MKQYHFKEHHGEALKKGLLMFQKARGYRTGSDLSEPIELSDEEKATLKEEVESRWHQPRTLYLTIGLNSIAAAIQGWDQTGVNGANLVLPAVFGFEDSNGQCCTPSCKWSVKLHGRSTIQS